MPTKIYSRIIIIKIQNLNFDTNLKNQSNFESYHYHWEVHLLIIVKLL